ncbi:alpha/beta fold hydrolase [Saccharibacillus kuerlensis]|uniref:Hydrolase YcgS n=1 Tax=Saccharibacillus kuerlensis TaxID=459527 RepID=A0ABQ2L367_9BACL|nr:alpha/beta hydrolase [Saccharibacillus kuerlensis]GGO01025.1 putative hydrolase YcgS [Saccharibacillus kuerlensis]
MSRTTGIYEHKQLSLEYSIVNPGGSPILVMHGGHSSCNEELGYAELEQQGYSVLTPSRPGYGQSSSTHGADLSTACLAYIKLLDHLHLDQVHVIGISAGGPSAIRFASQYPERVKSLTLQCAVSGEWLTSKDKEYKATQILFHPSREKYTWKLLGSMASFSPRLVFKQMAPSFSQLPYAALKSLISDSDIQEFKKMIQRQRSGQGFLIDLTHTASVTPEELQSIKCPTLILHSRNDATVSVDHAYHAHQHIPNSKLCVLESWGHLIWLGEGAADMQAELMNFLDAHK